MKNVTQEDIDMVSAMYWLDWSIPRIAHELNKRHLRDNIFYTEDDIWCIIRDEDIDTDYGRIEVSCNGNKIMIHPSSIGAENERNADGIYE